MRSSSSPWLAALLTAFCAWTSSWAAAASAEEPLTIRYDVNANEVQQGETFQLDIVLTVHTQEPVEEIALPDIPHGLTVIQERRSSSTQIGALGGRNTKFSIEQRYMYLLRGDDVGTFKIPEATARLGKSVARSAAVTVKVVAGADTNGAGAGAAGATSAPAGSVAGARFGKSPPAAFLEVTVDRDSAFVGQQVTATTEVFTQEPLGQWPRLPPLKPPGFFCTPLLGDERPSPSQRSIAGHLYYVYLVNKDALFPVKDGDVTIPATSVDLQPAGSFFSRPHNVNVKSLSLKLKVKPLPADDRPARFAPGNVGIFTLASTVRPQTASLDQPVTLSIIATGTGSLEQVQMPTWDPAEADAVGARVFPSTSKLDRRDVNGDDPELGGRVAVEMLVQPTKEGDLHIPSFSLAYFDPYAGGGAGAYKTSSTKPLVVPVRAGKNGSLGGGGGAGGGGRNTIARGARPLKSHVAGESRASDAPVFAGVFALVAGAAVLAARARKLQHLASTEGKRATKRRDRQRALDDAKARGDLAGLERVLLDAVADRCGPEAKSKPSSELASFLEERGLERAVADDVVRFIRDVEAARYSPGASSERARLAESCLTLIAKVEDAA